MTAAGRPWLSVFIGAALALTASTFLAVTLGNFIAARVPARLLRLLSGSLFLATGIWLAVRQLS
jgi:putative Ca2+/H+ antiporter (TMEM165/GDT1 family)